MIFLIKPSKKVFKMYYQLKYFLNFNAPGSYFYFFKFIINFEITDFFKIFRSFIFKLKLLTFIFKEGW